MNSNLEKLQPYPFERLAELKSGIVPPAHLKHIALSIGEPKHPVPEFVKQVIKESVNSIESYPTTKGTLELRDAISSWLQKRFQLNTGVINPDSQVLPVCGTREAIFAFTQAMVSPATTSRAPVVVSPNPFYQIYEGAALLAGAEIVYLNCTVENNFIPDLMDVPVDVWQRCELLQLCSPGNPTGAVMPLEKLQQAILLADKYDFIIACDECYSEVYLEPTAPPPGLLQACHEMGRLDFSRCVVFHSLSKRSNVPGLRSGFIAGDQHLVQRFLRYRTYHGCSMSLPNQKASAAAWSDEQHTIENRALYRHKFDTVTSILSPHLNFPTPEASFYLWAETPIDDRLFAQKLYAQQNVTVLPGRFLSRHYDNVNPGQHRVRMALVADADECVEAAWRIVQFVVSLTK
jgi:N-succinyldiaminopimelate aminotransferase